MSFESDFEKFDSGSGVFKIPGMPEIPYQADYYINGEGTVAVAAADDPMGKGKKYIFYSKCSGREVVTQPGRAPGSAEIEGMLLNTAAGEDLDAMLASHVEAVGGDAVADKEALKAAIADVPQRAADLSMKLMAQMMAAMKG